MTIKNYLFPFARTEAKEDMWRYEKGETKEQ